MAALSRLPVQESSSVAAVVALPSVAGGGGAALGATSQEMAAAEEAEDVLLEALGKARQPALAESINGARQQAAAAMEAAHKAVRATEQFGREAQRAQARLEERLDALARWVSSQ